MLKKLKILLSIVLTVNLVACSKQDREAEKSVPVAFRWLEKEETKVTVVTESSLDVSGFFVSATTGTPGSESSAWNSVEFSKNGDVFEGGVEWPGSNPSYHFYASNASIVFNSAGSSITVNNTTDYVCGYMQTPTYKEVNTLYMKHIFARLGNFELEAVDDFTISDVSVYLTPKTGGTYNLRTGAGQTDGTGWSGLVSGSPVNISPSTEGTKANDIWLVPGTYTLTASWTAEKGGGGQSYYNKETTVNLVGGAVNNIAAYLNGEVDDIVFVVTVEPWNSNTIAVGTVPLKTYDSFGGLQIASAPLFYNGETFVIKDDDWNHDSYGSKLGKTPGSYYFSFFQLGSYFDADGPSFTISSGDIDNANKVSYNGYDDWRLPTRAEWCTITTGESPGVSRTGSTVNGGAGVKYSLISLTGVRHAGQSTVVGLLLFPDGKTISGKTLLGYNTYSTITNNVTGSELDTYLNQGCVFLPASGYNYNGTWYLGGYAGGLLSSTQVSTDSAFYLELDDVTVDPTAMNSKNTYFYSVRLVRNN